MPIRNGIGWLSSSSAEIVRARAVLDALRKPGVIDELGFLMLNAAFADHLYPGVTTIMTRARYLVFIPAIYQHLEESGKARGKDADRVARDLQFELRNALAQNEESFIGKESGRNLLRTPAAVYWTALNTLAIAARRISEASYQRQLSDGTFGRSTYKDDDGIAHDDEPESMWNPALKLGHVMPDGQFPVNTSFRLRRSEASFLEAQYAALKPDGNDALVTRMVHLGRRYGLTSIEAIEYPWEVPELPEPMRALLTHARHLSLLARGMTLQYFRMIIEKRRDDDQGVESAFVEWWEQSRDDLAAWVLTDFFKLMTVWSAGRGSRDHRFISSWISRILAAKTGLVALRDPDAKHLIVKREDDVRPGKQRLRVRHQLDSWRLPDGATRGLYQMDYRHRVGCQIAQDIVAGLEGSSA